MISYFDGKEAQVGDVIELAHGQHTGTVIAIIESGDDLSDWDLERPGLLVDTTYGGSVFYDQAHVLSEQVKLKSKS